MEAFIQTQVHVVYLCGPSPEGKFYVGQTSDFARRCRSHASGQGGCPNFHNAVRRFGWLSFPIRVLAQTDSVDEADQLERRYIAQYNALYPHGYNMTTGGRSTLFDPEARPDPSFVESSITQEELVAEGQWRLAHPTHPYFLDLPGECPVCGEVCSCQVDAVFGRSVLEHFLSGGVSADYVLGESRELRKSLQTSVDASWLISLAKENMDVCKTDETLPVVAVQYVERLTPFIERSLRRSVLAKKGLPSFSQGRLRIVPGPKSDILVSVAVAKAFRRARRELGETLSSRVNVFHQLLETYGTNPARAQTTINLLTVRGASTEELTEALADADLRRELAAADLRELGMLTAAFPDRDEREWAWNQRLLAGDLRNWNSTNGAPDILVSKVGPSPSIRVVIFPSLAARRDYVRELLALDPVTRLMSVRKAVTGKRLEVRDISLPCSDL